jgi:hypothetical protein
MHGVVFKCDGFSVSVLLQVSAISQVSAIALQNIGTCMSGTAAVGARASERAAMRALLQ